jgi:hypothetical protein
MLESGVDLGLPGYGRSARGAAEPAVVSDRSMPAALAALTPILSSRCRHCSSYTTPFTLARVRSRAHAHYNEAHTIQDASA